MPNKITRILLAVGLASSVHAADLILHYEFEEGSGATAASSLNSNTANTLNLVGSSDWGTSMPGFGKALSITGLNGHAEATDPTSWSAQTITGSDTGSMSMALWVKFTALPNIGGVPTLMGTVSNAANSYHNQMIIRVDANGVTPGDNEAFAWGNVFGNDGGTTAANMNTSRTISPVVVDAWTHYALTFDSTTKTIIFYVNGEPVDTATNPSWAGYWSASELVKAVVGSDATTNSASGLYDDVRIYSGVLTPEEVMAIAPTPVEPSFTVTEFIPDFENQQVTITWESIEGTSYDLEVSPDLTPNSWEFLGPIFIGAPGDSTTVTEDDPAMATNPKRFYRVKETSP